MTWVQMSKSSHFDDSVVTYDLVKFRRTNQDTCINLKPIVQKGDKVKQGQALCDGFATEKGELALGNQHASGIHALAGIQL